MNNIERSARLKQIYISNKEIGAYLPDFFTWYQSIVLFHPAGAGGIAINTHEIGSNQLWWLTLYCPGNLPGIDTLKNIVALCVIAGCKALAGNFNMERYKNKDLERAFKLQTLLKHLGFKPLGENLLCFQSQ